MKGSLTIGVSAAAGGGKSTLVRALGERIDGAVMVFFDDHPVTMPANPLQWLAEGADFNEWKSDSLDAELTSLRERRIPVVFEAPLGRAHTATGRFIDLLVFIDTPLEVALARWVRRRMGENSSAEEIPVLLDIYETVLRPVYLEQRRQVMPGADLVVDGLQEVEVWVDQVMRVAPPAGLP
jgi:uridine kinase